MEWIDTGSFLETFRSVTLLPPGRRKRTFRRGVTEDTVTLNQRGHLRLCSADPEEWYQI